MDRKSLRSIRVLAVLAASAALSAPAFADGGHAQGRGSFSSGGNRGSGQHGGGASRGDGGGRSMGGQRNSSSGERSYSAPRSSGNFSTNRGSRNEGRNFGSDVRRAPPSSTGNRYSGTRPGAQASNDTPTFRANPRPGFQTTRPDFGVGNRYSGGGARPGFTTRPDMNGRPGFDQRYSNNGSRNDRPSANYRPPGGNGRSSFNGRPGFDGRYGYNRNPGYRGGVGYSHRSYWRGGYWNGSFWPRVYYRPNFVSFWPILPAAYSTYYWSGIPYYYVDDVYYTWNPSRYGYVATEPPPAAESAPVEDNNVEDSNASGSASVFVYPRNGQSEEQTSNDRFECHQWAASQTGFDPTTATPDAQNAASASDYRRAIIACLDARGYSAN